VKTVTFDIDPQTTPSCPELTASDANSAYLPPETDSDKYGAGVLVVNLLQDGFSNDVTETAGFTKVTFPNPWAITAPNPSDCYEFELLR
jgi:hypothetical protein